MVIHEAELAADSDWVMQAQMPSVLIVDDSRAHRRLLAKSLARWGYAAAEAEGGESALRMCRDGAFDLVISDWMMPGMSGVEFCRAFRALRGERPGYFILLTAQTDRDILAEGLESGADDFLSKPFNAVELKARIRAGERVLHAQRELIGKNALLSDTLADLRRAQDLIESDLKEARRFQQALVPERFLSRGQVDVSMLYQPSGHVGGDLVGTFPVDDRRIGIYSVDVSGHGIASALMTARIAGMLSATALDRNIALVAKRGGGYAMRPPSEVCETLNRLLMQEPDLDKYLTMSLADVDLESGEVVLCQAGHPSALVQRADGRVAFEHCPGMPIGLIDGAEYEETILRFAPGDRLLLYSDGLTECPGKAGALWDEEGLKACLERHRAQSGPTLLNEVLGALQAFSGLTDFPDDLSALMLEFREDAP